MKPTISPWCLIALMISMFVAAVVAAEPAQNPGAEEVNKVCPISGKAVDPSITLKYEGRTYAFSSDSCRTQFKQARENSLYQKLGGKAAIDAVVEAFYVKVLADNRIKHLFDDINMTKQRRKQKEFLSAAFGGPIPWTGKDLAKAHANIPGLTDAHFDAVAENLQKTLVELKVKKELADQVMAIAASTREAVLNRKPAAR